MTITFDIDHPGEPAAGIGSYVDSVDVTVQSGNPGGDLDEFVYHMKDALAAWYDGARVRPVEVVRDDDD